MDVCHVAFWFHSFGSRKLMLPTCTKVEPGTNKSDFQLRAHLWAVAFYKVNLHQGVLVVVTSGSCGGSGRRPGLFLSRDFVIAKRNKRNFETRASTCGTGTVTCWGLTHWVPFCTAILPMQRGVICKSFCTKKVWLRKHPKIIMTKVTFWDTSVSLGSFIRRL